MKNVRKPFFICNPKSYLYGKECLDLAKNADNYAEKYNTEIFFTAPYTDLAKINNNTENIIVTAQHMDPLNPGRGMGHVLPESLKAAGAKAVFLNHAEHSLKLNVLVKTIKKTKELGLISIVCADSLEEAIAIAKLGPDILLCEPTELIGTGQTSDFDYIIETTNKIKEIDESILVMQASGISTGEDVYNTIVNGADGTGATSGIMESANKSKKLEEMIQAISKAKKEIE